MTIMLAVVFLAEVASTSESWILTLANYGVAGCMLIYFIWRDKKTEERRETARQESNKFQKDNTAALNLMTRAMMVEVIATRNMDASIKELAEKIKDQAEQANQALSPS